MATKTAPEPAKTDAEEPKGQNRLVLVFAVVGVLALLGGAAFFFGLIGGGEDAEGAEPTVEPTPTELGMVVQLDSLTLNLASGRFLKLGVAVEMAPGLTVEPPTAPIYDELIDLFAPLTFEELTIATVREETKTTLLDRLRSTYGDDIAGVYYTEFVMQ